MFTRSSIMFHHNTSIFLFVQNRNISKQNQMVTQNQSQLFHIVCGLKLLSMFFSTWSSLFTSVQLKVLITTLAVCQIKLESFYDKDRELTYIQTFFKKKHRLHYCPRISFSFLPSIHSLFSPALITSFSTLPLFLPLFLYFSLLFLCLQYFIFLSPSLHSLDFFTQTL